MSSLVERDHFIKKYKEKFDAYIKLRDEIHTNNYVELVNNDSTREIMESLIRSEIKLCNLARKNAYMDESKIVLDDDETKPVEPCRFNHNDIFIDPKKLYYRVYDFYVQQLRVGINIGKVYKVDGFYTLYKQRILWHENMKNICGPKDFDESQIINRNQSYV